MFTVSLSSTDCVLVCRFGATEGPFINFVVELIRDSHTDSGLNVKYSTLSSVFLLFLFVGKVLSR